ncbi:hypothetical protein DRP77_05910 [Candidatus Poribacteria bacterium]|nr:MAG: hypothetical protein DRP77_05910 [Candidatus Poribacteria bacterium]
MNFPEEVLTKSKKGKVEVRSLVDAGKFVRYEYLDPQTGSPTESKRKLVLIKGDGSTEEYFIIPLKDGRFLMIPTPSKGERMVWDGEKAVDIFSL